MNIALYGIYGTYNFGCEAIVRGARQFAKDIYPDATVKYFSYSYDYDRKALADLDIEVVRITEHRKLLKRAVNKGLKLLGGDRRLFYFNEKEILSDIDIILSIGGDIYTIPAVFREHEKYPYYNSLVDFCDRAIIEKEQVIVYGASVGPWGGYQKAVDYYAKHMMKYSAILCREQASIEYLQGLGFSNTMFFPDPAFQLGTGEYRDGTYIGINLSPLSFNELYGGHGGEQVAKMANLLDKIYTEFHRPLLFLPHVLSNDEHDNDLWFLEKIKRRMKYGSEVLMADSSKGFLGIKEQLRDCYMVISARMHCAINAIGENIPTIFLSYSQKSIGMCEYVYGNRDWVIGLKNADSDLIRLIENMDRQHTSIVKLLSYQNERIHQDYVSNIEEVKKVLCL